MLLLASSNEDGTGFMETSTLDGEKHLKQRASLKETVASVNNKLNWHHGEVQGTIDIDLEIVVSVQ
jgi:hypothetical protein